MPEGADGERIEGTPDSTERLLTALVENTTDPIYIKDAEGRLEFVNQAAAATFGLEPADIIGQYDADLFDAETAAEIRRIDSRTIETGVADTREAVREIDGTRYVFLENTYPYRTRDGDIVGVMGISHDITEIRRREHSLQRKHDRLDEFASVVSHDLINPLTVAQGRLALARTEVESEHLDVIETALDRIEAVVTKTLALARQGQVVTDPEPFWVTDLVARCWAMVGAEDATLELADEFTVTGDPDRLQHVFENLFRNAVTHAGPDVRVRIGRLGADGFYVEDDGPGIPQAERVAVFDPGHRSGNGGTGFGLTIVSRIVDAHDWTVSITDGTDGGARFEFRDVPLSASADDSSPVRGPTERTNE